jgi:hypothetical protein
VPVVLQIVSRQYGKYAPCLLEVLRRWHPLIRSCILILSYYVPGRQWESFGVFSFWTKKKLHMILIAF